MYAIILLILTVFVIYRIIIDFNDMHNGKWN